MTAAKCLRRVLGILSLSPALFSAPLLSQDCSPDNPNVAQSFAGSMGFLSGSSGITSSDVQDSIGYWTSSCSNDGIGFPSLVASSNADILVSVQLLDTRSPHGTCGTASLQLNGSSQITGGTITLYTMRGDGTLCQEHYVDVLAHEIGHFLGLGNATDPTCAGSIMGSQIGIQPRTVEGEDCLQAGRGWQTPIETETCGGVNCDDHGPCGT